MKKSYSLAESFLASVIAPRPVHANNHDEGPKARQIISKCTFLQTMTALTVIGLLTLLSVVPQAAAQGRRAEAFARVKEVQEKHLQNLMDRFGVVGSGIGLNQQGEPAIKVFVETLADAAGLPQVLDGVPVAAKVTGKIVALACPNDNPTAMCGRPVPIGVSTGHPLVTAGTIGARVIKNGQVYALSNNHVFANENNAVKAGPGYAGDPVLQPGQYDNNYGDYFNNIIGTLHDFEPIKFCTPFFIFWLCSQTNQIDAAIASSTTSLLDNSTPPYGYGKPKSAIYGDINGDGVIDGNLATLLLGLTVQKCGRTTGCTTGTITDVNFTIDVGYGTGTARFVDQIIVGSNDAFIGGGDSGSLLVDLNVQPVGLLFAGGSGGTLAVANRIDLVLNRFAVTVDGEDAPPPQPVAPVAAFSGTPTSGNHPLTVNFTDQSTNNPTSWNWDFGDGNPASTVQNPSHIYTVAGTYTVTLTVANAGGSDGEIKTNYITVNTPPATTMHVASISVTREGSSSRRRGVATVTIVNASDQSVQGVTVTGDFWGPRTDNNRTGTTNSSGQATLKSGWQRNPQGKWCFRVTNVIGGGLTYNSAANLESQDCEP